MRLAGLGLLLSGWIIAVAALPLLAGGERAFFIAAGLLVEIVGFVLLGRAHRTFEGGRE